MKKFILSMVLFMGITAAAIAADSANYQNRMPFYGNYQKYDGKIMHMYGNYGNRPPMMYGNKPPKGGYGMMPPPKGLYGFSTTNSSK